MFKIYWISTNHTFFSLSKANYIISRNNHDLKVEVYNYEWTDQKCNYDISRQVILIDYRLNYICRNDLESIRDCTIWIEIKIKRQKSILVCSAIDNGIHLMRGEKVKREAYKNIIP